MLPIIDTHTHFDVPDFDIDRSTQAMLAYQNGVRHLVLIGYLAKFFDRMQACQSTLNTLIKEGNQSPMAHLAVGLHPFYIHDHHKDDIALLENFIRTYQPIALGEIGLDTFTPEMKVPETYTRQQEFFNAQLALATDHQLPILLHIRKAHGDTLKLLKAHKFTLGGIAHSFSGGIEEAKAFVKLGFKIGITGQITNPNAKKLRTTIYELTKTMGLDTLVIETDCPDFTPMCCHHSHGRRNTPANLIFVLEELSHLTQTPIEKLAPILWQNSEQAFGRKFPYHW